MIMVAIIFGCGQISWELKYRRQIGQSAAWEAEVKGAPAEGGMPFSEEARHLAYSGFGYFSIAIPVLLVGGTLAAIQPQTAQEWLKETTPSAGDGP